MTRRHYFIPLLDPGFDSLASVTCTMADAVPDASGDSFTAFMKRRELSEPHRLAIRRGVRIYHGINVDQEV
jgi:hypothetical protein